MKCRIRMAGLGLVAMTLGASAGAAAPEWVSVGIEGGLRGIGQPRSLRHAAGADRCRARQLPREGDASHGRDDVRSLPDGHDAHQKRGPRPKPVPVKKPKKW
jgi:hypothetical protein